MSGLIVLGVLVVAPVLIGCWLFSIMPDPVTDPED